MKVLSDERGQSTILMAVFMGLFLFGFTALALDVEYMFHEKRVAQSAADAAAIAASEESAAGDIGNEQTAANAMAKLNGFDPSLATNPATVTVSAPTSGNYAGATSYVQVVVSKSIPTFFLSVFNRHSTSLVVSARAVASGGQTSPTCICLEGPAGMDLNMSNNAQISAPGCGITADSSSTNVIGIVGSAGLNALSLGTVSSNWDNSGNINNGGSISSTTKVVQGIATQCKPVLTVPTLPSGIACYNNPINGWTAGNNYTGVYTLPLAGETPTSGVVCFNSLNTGNAASVTFSPGYTYYIKGDFTTGGGAPVTGNNVTFYVGGNINIANGVTANLSAPTVGTNPPIPQTLLYAMGTTVTIQGGSNSAFSGLIYAPNAAVTLNNGTGTTMNMDFVAQTLSLAGGATLTSYSTSNLGTLNISVAKITE